VSCGSLPMLVSDRRGDVAPGLHGKKANVTMAILNSIGRVFDRLQACNVEALAIFTSHQRRLRECAEAIEAHQQQLNQIEARIAERWKV
jgi:hypothetical protein